MIRKALEGLEGVEKAEVSFRQKQGIVYFDPGRVSEEQIVEEVNRIGFKARTVNQ